VSNLISVAQSYVKRGNNEYEDFKLGVKEGGQAESETKESAKIKTQVSVVGINSFRGGFRGRTLGEIIARPTEARYKLEKEQ